MKLSEVIASHPLISGRTKHGDIYTHYCEDKRRSRADYKPRDAFTSILAVARHASRWLRTYRPPAFSLRTHTCHGRVSLKTPNFGGGTDPSHSPRPQGPGPAYLAAPGAAGRVQRGSRPGPAPCRRPCHRRRRPPPTRGPP